MQDTCMKGLLRKDFFFFLQDLIFMEDNILSDFEKIIKRIISDSI